MIKNENVVDAMKQDYAHDVIATDLKRVIIPLPSGIKGNDVEYVEWDGSKAIGNGFLFANETDKREQFIKAEGGIFIGHEGECPEGPNGNMIMRSEAVSKYFSSHPRALDNEENIKKTVEYLQNKVFRHDRNDPTKWDGKEVPDMWTSDDKWLKKNFSEQDIFNEDGSIKKVISAAKKTEQTSRSVYYGPNSKVEGLGETGDRGSWTVKKPDGKIDLCTEEVFNKTYKSAEKPKSAKIIISDRGVDVAYPKGSMRYMSPEQLNSSKKLTSEEVVNGFRERCKELQTPVLRVLGSALCDKYEAKGKFGLEFNGLLYCDKNPLNLEKDNPKSNLLRSLLKDKIIDTDGKILNATKFAESDFIKDFKGMDLSDTKTVRKMRVNTSNINLKTLGGRS